MSHCFVGFDGFIDEIIHAVEKRTPQGYLPYPTMTAFSEKIAHAANKSCNIELVVQRTKVGGNGPILASALLLLGHKVTLAGNLGIPKIDPLFHSLIEQCVEAFTYENPGHTDALEFSDGKIILGKLEPLHHITPEKVLDTIGVERFTEILDGTSLFVSANWTMLPMTNDLWRLLLKLVIPKLSLKKRYFFVDLADPAKRSDRDLKEALDLLEKFNETFHVVLGLNHAEAIRIAKILGTNPTTEALLQKLHVNQIVLHSSKSASTSTKNETAVKETFFTSNPLMTTGAGDNFNAGFCHGLLQNLTLENSLLIGNACAGFYVRKGRSPSTEELAIFLQSWDNI